MRRPQSPAPPPPPASNSTASINHTASMANTIKLLPTSASMRAFSGSDPDSDVRKFLHLCEDVMTNSCVTDPSDKIAFVRSRLQPRTRPCKLMQASAFTEAQDAKDYDVFR